MRTALHLIALACMLALASCALPLSVSKDADYRYEHVNPDTGAITNFSVSSRRDVVGPATLTVSPDGTVSVTTGGLTAREQQAVDSALLQTLLGRFLPVPAPSPVTVQGQPLTTTPEKK